jgi:hypothetical protein
MTKRYARIASAQVRQAVSGLDSVLLPAQEQKTAYVSHPFVTGNDEKKVENEPNALESWRPQGDSNPRYRRERAMS